MAIELSKKAKKVQEFIIEKGFELNVKELPASTRTAKDAASALGCEVAQIAKSLIFLDEAESNPVLIIASGINRVNLDKIAAASGKKLKLSPRCQCLLQLRSHKVSTSKKMQWSSG